MDYDATDRPVQVPTQFRDDIRRLERLAAIAESKPSGSARAELVDHLVGIRSRLSDDSPSEFRSVILRESGLAILLGAPSIDEVEQARLLLAQSVNLGWESGALQVACLADLATADIAKALAANDRTSLLSALARGDDPASSAGLLAQSGLALSLIPLIAPDLMATSLDTPEQFTNAIPSWEERVSTYGAQRLDRFLLPLASARLHLLRAFNTTGSSSPSPVDRVAAAVLLVERFAPARTTRTPRWAKTATFAALAVGTMCSTSVVSIALLRTAAPEFRQSADDLLQRVAAKPLTSPRALCNTTAWLTAEMSEMTGASSLRLQPRFSLAQFEGLLRSSDEVDSVVGATQVVGRDLGLVIEAVQRWSD